MRNRFALAVALVAGAFLVTAPVSAGPVGAAAGTAEVAAKAADTVHWRKKHRKHFAFRHHRRHHHHRYARFYGYGYSPYYYRPYYSSYYYQPYYYYRPYRYHRRPHIGIYLRF